MKLIEEKRKMSFYDHLREIAVTLNTFCLIEIGLIIFFSWMCFDLLTWYKAIMTVESFNGMAFWGAMTGLVATIFASMKNINETLKGRLDDTSKERKS